MENLDSDFIAIFDSTVTQKDRIKNGLPLEVVIKLDTSTTDLGKWFEDKFNNGEESFRLTKEQIEINGIKGIIIDSPASLTGLEKLTVLITEKGIYALNTSYGFICDRVIESFKIFKL